MKYRINFGYDQTGRPRRRYYLGLAEAREAANLHFQRTGIILSIVAA